MKAETKEAKTKAAVFRAAIDEFIACGFYGARMQRIADRAGVNKAMIHYYFRNKKTVYTEVLDNALEILIIELNSIGSEELKIEKKLGQIVDVYIRIFSKYNNYVKLLLYEVIRGGAELRKLISAKSSRIPLNPANGAIYTYFKKEIKKGRLKKINVIQLFISIVSQMAPLFFVKDMFKDMIKIPGMQKLVFNKLVKNRKKFVIDLILNGIKPAGNKQRR
ncbi:MAG TPA: TetR/AcrR family transcriptional regulator [Spirochaetota bacterium]|nr:TetR/AcrR family transcriptional regulator [Spirochaetota bacterium]